MRKILSTLVLPIFVLTAAFSGMPVASAANILDTVSGTDSNTGATNDIILEGNLVAPLAIGDTVTIMARNQDGSPLALTAGPITIEGNAETTVATADPGTLEITLTNAVAAGATFFTIDGLQITNPATPQNVSFIITTSTGEMGAMTYAIAGADTVTINALVESTLSMVLSSNTINFGAVPIGSVVESAPLGQTTGITVTTNAANGYILNAAAGAWDGNQEFRLIAFADAYQDLTAGQEGFALQVENTPATLEPLGAGTAAIAPGIAAPLVSSATSTNADTTVVEYAVSVNSTTPQGPYTETVTYSVTAQF